MGALAPTVLALCSAADLIVLSCYVYAGTPAFVHRACGPFGIEHPVSRTSGRVR